MRTIWTKHFDYFQGLKALKCHRTKRLICINYRSKWPLQKTFLRSTPPPAWISGVFDPPSRENFQNPIRWGGVDFFWNNPIYGKSIGWNPKDYKNMPQLRYSLYMAKKRHIQKRQVFALYSFFVFEHTTSFFCCIKHVILLCTSLFSSLEWWSPKRNESCNPFILSYNITPNGFISKSEWVKCNSKLRRKTWHFLLKETDVASSKS